MGTTNIESVIRDERYYSLSEEERFVLVMAAHNVNDKEGCVNLDRAFRLRELTGYDDATLKQIVQSLKEKGMGVIYQPEDLQEMYEKRHNRTRAGRRRVSVTEDPEYTSLFEAWWESYPEERRVDKAKCFALWEEYLREGIATAELMFYMLIYWLNSSDWNKDCGEFICTSLRFLQSQPWDALNSNVLKRMLWRDKGNFTDGWYANGVARDTVIPLEVQQILESRPSTSATPARAEERAGDEEALPF